ncbi:hypothetical protein COCSUDRAFT_36042 [Coccomyxa subellipsoidea C-169]|uniref:Uncharacterized protein n=1 Tax=Coccomyxa subellipsoidea (strain C-169) TaxID=574566 RepID=I0Z238_COCSC|nr:hypothetical protein COCSUDRAFT_36042 [Coccomyxa subellipsoidea C-169]EIE24707.1 hypothetical protein COCSUDRAFT_36042 [Coccomyxa subellipsoidea C-169]|eukprot:XP_005649251.1 hypothetical protein COCSUDRAFT_36042 [Coccomyxa subellipsoidea C-169]
MAFTSLSRCLPLHRGQRRLALWQSVQLACRAAHRVAPELKALGARSISCLRQDARRHGSCFSVGCSLHCRGRKRHLRCQGGQMPLICSQPVAAAWCGAVIRLGSSPAPKALGRDRCVSAAWQRLEGR